MADTRVEKDTMGEIAVPRTATGARRPSDRSNISRAAGQDTMPRELIRAFGILKKAAALANVELGAARQGQEAIIAQRRRRGDRRASTTRFPARRLADRLAARRRT